MKKIIKVIAIIFLIFLYIYVYNISAIPSNIVIFQGEKINIRTAIGLKLENANKYETALTSSSINKEKISGTNTIDVSLFGQKVRSVNVDVIENTKVVPLGIAIGMKLYTKGVLVVGMSEIETGNNIKEKPYKQSGISEGDSIIEVNNKEITSTNELIEEVNKSDGNELSIKYIKDNEILETSITPVKKDNEYKIGLWVRDAAAGVGTLTFYEPSSNMFIALGHGIMDIDTNEIVDIASGELVTANILSIVKGVKNTPGEIRGTITNGKTIGQIYNNTNFGVYGTMKNSQYLINNSNAVDVSKRDEIKEGKATIICQLDNSEPREYEIEIEKIYINNNEDNKSMLIKITDQELIEKTGGIIQGMSGAPILQNGKFVGAVTNVLVKDPTQGYGVFGDLLIKQMRKVV